MLNHEAWNLTHYIKQHQLNISIVVNKIVATSTNGRHCSKIGEDDHVGASSNVDLNIIIYDFIPMHACL